MVIAELNIDMPQGCAHCRYFRKDVGFGLEYRFSCLLDATQIPMPWVRQQDERASDCLFKGGK